MSLRSLRAWYRQQRIVADLAYLAPLLREADDIGWLSRAMGWTETARVEGAHLDDYEYPADLNHRRRRDAEVVAAACRNAVMGDILEIGTGRGYMTAIMAENAPDRTVHTLNIPPEDIRDGGSHTTFAPARDEIGSYYRARGCSNVRQIYANSLNWTPDSGPFSVAFIDGSHDAAFVEADTLKVLSCLAVGGVVIWHDFSPRHAFHYDWIASVVRGVRRMVERKAVKGELFHLRNSWTAVYRNR